MILGAGLTTVGAVIAKLDPSMLANGAPMTDAAQSYADYLFARDLPLAVMLLILLVLQARQMLARCMVLTAPVQLLDGLDDAARGEWLLVPGELVFTLVLAVCASRLFERGFWRREVGR